MEKFTLKLEKSPRFANKWLPLKEKNRYGTRNEEFYRIVKPRTERAIRNPVDYYRRKLNKLHRENSK